MTIEYFNVVALQRNYETLSFVWGAMDWEHGQWICPPCPASPAYPCSLCTLSFVWGVEKEEDPPSLCWEGVTRPDFCSWPSRLFQAFRLAQDFSRYNLLPGKGVQQVTVPYFPWWCYNLQNVRTASTRVCHWEEEGFVQ